MPSCLPVSGSAPDEYVVSPRRSSCFLLWPESRPHYLLAQTSDMFAYCSHNLGLRHKVGVRRHRGTLPHRGPSILKDFLDMIVGDRFLPGGVVEVPRLRRQTGGGNT